MGPHRVPCYSDPIIQRLKSDHNMASWKPLFLCGLTLLALSPALVGSFHFDDYFMLTDPVVQARSGWWEVFGFDRTRPLSYLTFWLNYQLGGDDPLGYHILNLLLHLATVLAAWYVFRRLATDRVALLAAGLFALHPVQTEPVNYVFARATILTTLFCLLAWSAWIDGRYKRSVFHFALALLAKEEAAALPLFLLGYEYLYQGYRGAPKREWVGPLGVMLLVCAFIAAPLDLRRPHHGGVRRAIRSRRYYGFQLPAHTGASRVALSALVVVSGRAQLRSRLCTVDRARRANGGGLARTRCADRLCCLAGETTA